MVMKLHAQLKKTSLKTKESLIDAFTQSISQIPYDKEIKVNIFVIENDRKHKIDGKQSKL